MSYYQFHKQELLWKGKDKNSQEKGAKYYLKNKEVIKGK